VSRRVSLTPTARRQAVALRRKAAAAYGEIVERLAAEGCAAADYRLTGDIVNRFCALHFYARYRALVRFPEDEHVVLILIAEHDRGSKDVYAAALRTARDDPAEGEEVQAALLWRRRRAADRSRVTRSLGDGSQEAAPESLIRRSRPGQAMKGSTSFRAGNCSPRRKVTRPLSVEARVR
jgi:hypothetical protein